jgi:hypothetical protein
VIDGTALIALAVLVLGDQNRLQPWVFQYWLTMLALASSSPARAVRTCRIILVALYVHSGLSKLDYSFGRELGLTILEQTLHPIGYHPVFWSERVALGAVLAMPVVEIAAGVGLCFRSTRRIALASVVVLHAALIGILGPRGLGHSTIVLVWNAAMIVEALILFLSVTQAAQGASPWPGPVGLGIIIVVVALPLGERVGIWDTWPSFGLYASHAERADVYLHESSLRVYPSAVLKHVSSRGERPWRRLDLTAWSRASRGVPLYPQARVTNGLAEALARWDGRPRPVMVRQWSRAEPFAGRRDMTSLVGYDAISQWGERFWLNAHPARGSWPGSSAADERGMR